MSDAAPSSWDAATPDEIRDARIAHLEEGLEHLKVCVCEALLSGNTMHAAALILDEEWSK